MLDKQREDQYRKFKDTLSNNNDHDQDLDRSRLFINKIKDHRHDKIKTKHIGKFKKLYFKHHGCHYNLSSHTNNSGNINSIPNTLSRQPNVPSSISTTSTTTSTSTSVPATPMAPTPSSSTADINLSHGQVGNKPFQNLLLQRTIIPPIKRPQFCHHPQIPPTEAYITATEQASSKLPAQEADEFRSGVNRILKQQQQLHNNHCNLNPSQCRALAQLKKDNSRVVLTADKGVAMVIMDQEDYTNKAQALLRDTNTYKVLTKDPTSQLKNKLISLLKDIKQTGGLTTHKYKQLYPTSAVPPKFYGLPKIHKTGTPLRPIVSSRGSITYGVAKELSHIIKPLVGQSPHHLKNTQHFIQQLQGKRLEPGEVITSFNVKALFTSVPVQPSIQLVKQRLQQDNTLPQRTSMSITQITSLLEFGLSHTYFLFQGKYYEQAQGAAMGSPISPLIANIFMEEFEVKALNSFPHPPLPFGSGLLMTPSLSTRQNTVRTYSSISTTRTHTYSSQWNQNNNTHFPSWTLLLP